MPFSFTERRLILRVYGKIVKHNGNGCLSQKRLSYIFRLLYSDASEQVKLTVTIYKFNY